MPADGIPSCHSPRTETSARPVAKSSSKEDYRIPRPSKRPSYGQDVAPTIGSRPMAPMSELGHMRPSADVIPSSALASKADACLHSPPPPDATFFVLATSIHFIVSCHRPLEGRSGLSNPNRTPWARAFRPLSVAMY